MKKILLFLFCILSFSNGFTQDVGSVDTSFGTDGVSEYTITVNGTLYGVTFNDLLALPDGKILAVGVASWGCSSTSFYAGIIMRLHANGEVDTTFHSEGYTLMSQQNFYEIVPIDDTYVYLISVNGIVKIDLGGNLDTSYGDNGFVELNMSGRGGILDDQGNIYFNARKSSGYTPLITKLNNQGVVDTTFGTDGEVTFPNAYRLRDMAFNSAGDLIIIGREFISYPNTKLLVIKMDADGTLDSSFADEGIFKYQTSYNSYGNLVHMMDDDKILGAGYGTLTHSAGLGMILFRLNTDGTLDTTFKDQGITAIPVFSDSSPRTIHPIENNNFLISGTGYNNMFAIKIDQDGNQDMSFGTDGEIITPTFEESGYNTASLLIDNTLLFCGNSMFAHCAQTRYKGYLTKYYVTESALSSDDFSTSQFNIYPNPVKDQLQIPIDAIEQKVKLKLFALNGAEIDVDFRKNTRDNLMEADLSNIKSGVYLLVKEVNGIRQIRKIIKS